MRTCYHAGFRNECEKCKNSWRAMKWSALLCFIGVIISISTMLWVGGETMRISDPLILSMVLLLTISSMGLFIIGLAVLFHGLPPSPGPL